MKELQVMESVTKARSRFAEAFDAISSVSEITAAQTRILCLLCADSRIARVHETKRTRNDLPRA